MTNITQLRPNTLFADLDAIQAAQLFVEEGVTMESAKKLHITPGLFTAWAASPEGMSQIRLLQRQLNSKLEARLTYILETVSESIVQSFKEGNEVVQKDGKIVKVRVDAAQASRVFGTLFDKRQLLRREPTAITDVDQKIRDLAEKLSAIGRAAQSHE